MSQNHFCRPSCVEHEAFPLLHPPDGACGGGHAHEERVLPPQLLLELQEAAHHAVCAQPSGLGRPRRLHEAALCPPEEAHAAGIFHLHSLFFPPLDPWSFCKHLPARLFILGQSRSCRILVSNGNVSTPVECSPKCRIPRSRSPLWVAIPVNPSYQLQVFWPFLVAASMPRSQCRAITARLFMRP